MKISDLVPNLYKNNIEMNNIIYTEEVELEENLKTAIDNKFKDTFASTATEQGIIQFENIFNIKPNTTTETLQFRKERIMTRLISSIPYTEKFLINKLNSILGEGNWSYTIDYKNYKLIIYSLIPGNSWYAELITFLDSTIPCNINWQIQLYYATWNAVLDKFNIWNNIKAYTWEYVLNGEWTTILEEGGN